MEILGKKRIFFLRKKILKKYMKKNKPVLQNLTNSNRKNNC